MSLQLLHLHPSSFCTSLVTIRTATMGSLAILTVTFHVLAWICTLQTLVVASEQLHLTHYTHEIRGGPNSTFLRAAGPREPNSTAGSWGMLIVYDNMMKDGPNITSTLLGRVTGTATGVVNPTTTGGLDPRVQLVMHHVFGNASIYNGSYMNILGISFSAIGPWEYVVPGCTGVLRGYFGYAIFDQILDTPGLSLEYLVYKWDFYLTKA